MDLAPASAARRRRAVALPVALGLAAALLAGVPAGAAQPATAARRVEPFDVKAWAALQAKPKVPTAVVFTTTDCAHCPAVIRQLAAQLKQAPAKARPTLITVVMDQAPGDDDAALLADAHFGASPRLMAFAGQAPALRHAVDPAWRGVTPYVVFLAPGHASRSVTGPPSADDLARWLAPTQRAP